jgi:hypothetical protein
MITTATAIASPAQLDHSVREGSLVAPPGFRPATAADLTDRPDGWVGPKIHASYLFHGHPETAATVAWTPEEGMVPILNADVYPNMDSRAVDDAYERLHAMLEYAALEAETTSPSELVRAYRANDDNLYNFDAPWHDTQDLVLNDREEPTLNASTVMGGSVPIGFHLTISLEDFENLGLDIHAEGENLELTGTREEVAAAADLFAKMGTKLKEFLSEQPA